MRITWIDTMKGVAMIAVVLGHVVQGYLVAGMFPEERTILQALFDFIYTWHMPLFFMASGYLYEMTWNERPSHICARILEKFFRYGHSVYFVFPALLGNKIYRRIAGADEPYYNDRRAVSYLCSTAILFVVLICIDHLVYSRSIVGTVYTG